MNFLLAKPAYIFYLLRLSSIQELLANIKGHLKIGQDSVLASAF